jgi:hypothetical protein
MGVRKTGAKMCDLVPGCTCGLSRDVSSRNKQTRSPRLRFPREVAAARWRKDSIGICEAPESGIAAVSHGRLPLTLSLISKWLNRCGKGARKAVGTLSTRIGGVVRQITKRQGDARTWLGFGGMVNAS